MEDSANPFMRDLSMGIPSPGTLLASQRKEYGWTQQEVARELNLSERQIRAIEEDDYDSLPGKTYVMGYWRSYANLFRISIDESIQVHRSNLNPDKDPLQPQSPDSDETEGSEQRPRNRGLMVFVLLLVFVGGIWWYWQNTGWNVPELIQRGADDRVDTISSEKEDSPALTDVPVSVIEGVPEPNFSENQAVAEIDTRGYEVLVFEAPISQGLIFLQAEDEATGQPEDSAADIAASSPAPPSNDSAESESASATSPDSPTTPAGPAAVTTAEPESPEIPPDPKPESVDHRIVFVVEGETWIDVRDSTGERLLYRTVNRGEDIELNGTPPYSVFLGSVDGVVVQYQGQEVPFEAHESGLFARFEVGE